MARFTRQGARYLDTKDKWERLAFMQHYGVPTKLMDWTTNVTAAIYFALAYNVKAEEDLQEPLIWILNPFALNGKSGSRKIFDNMDEPPELKLESREGNKWRLSGLFDFGDVMTGFGEYDLLGPSAFMTAGTARRVRSLFEGFGYSRADVTPDVKRRLMALMLLHRFSDPIRHICIEDWQARANDLFELQDLLWPG